MPQQSTDGVILEAAWKLLWTPNTPYYLPNVMKNGLHWNNINIPALEGSSVDKIGPISLFKDSVLGYISLTMDSNNITGLPSITNGGLTYDDNTHTVTFTIGFGQLNFAGNYEVDSGGITGCAIATANGLLNIFKMASAVGAGDPKSDANIDLAYQYRDKLSQPDNPNGNALVDAFYSQNDTMNTVVLAQNGVVNGQTNKTNGLFHNAWLKHTTAGNDTAYYMNVTSTASNQPDNQDTGFNNDDYNEHGFYMEVAMTIEAKSLRDLGDPRGEALYQSIYSNAANGTSLDQEAHSYGGNNINDFMGYVKSGGSQSIARNDTAAVQDHKAAIYARAKAKAEADHADWIANNRHEEYASGTTAFASLGDVSQLTGSFTDTFSTPTVTVSATVATKNDTLNVTVTELQANIPSLDVTLNPSHASSLNEKVQNAIANAGFMQNLLKTKIEKALGDDSVKKYLSDRVNQAIQKIFG